MAINNSFNKTWVVAFPWLSLEKTNEIKEKAKSMSDNTYEQSLIENDLYKYEIKNQTHKNFMKERQNVRMEADLRGTESKDPKVKKTMDSLNRTGALADMFREYGYMHGKNRDDMDDDVLISKFTTKNPSVKKYSDSFLTGWPDSEYRLAQELWITKTPQQKLDEAKEDSQLWKRLWVAGAWIGGLVWADIWLNVVGRWLEKAWEIIYDLPIDSSIQESKQIQNVGANIKDAEVAVRDAKKDLRAAKKAWEWVEEAEQALENAKNGLKTAKGKSVTTVADSAREYNVWGGITEWWTAESRWIQAKSEANQIFKKTINPALENSKATINVQELINSLEDDIVQLAKNDPDKLAAYGEALDSLKDSYKASEFANYSLKDSQTLKSWLQGRTPAKFWKGKEVTNELQELKGKLSSKLTNTLHKKLTDELWEDTWKLYKHRANLTEYADDMAKQATNGGLKWWFGNFWSTMYHNLTDGASSKVWLMLNKTGRGIKKVTDPVVDSIWDAWNYLAKNWKKLFKASKWGTLRVEDPTWVIQLLRLAPWSIWEIANQIGETDPAVVVDDLLFEIQDFKDNWNRMSDEERVQNIKEQYEQATGNELDDKSAQATYEQRKKKHPNGKYGLWDQVNDVDIVMSV